MSEAITLCEYFTMKQEELSKNENIKSFGEEIRKNFKAEKPIPWDKVEEKFLEKLLEIFNIPMSELWIGGWRKAKEIQEFADPEKYPPDKPYEVPLVTHNHKAEREVTVKIQIAALPEVSFPFTFGIETELEGVTLTIKAGKIMGISSGCVQLKAHLNWEKLELIRLAGPKYAIPGKCDLGDGLPIRSDKEING